jgi:Zn-dependent M28 family amino/carboxypeptidase
MTQIQTMLEQDLRKHVEFLTVEIGPRTLGCRDSLRRTEEYISASFERAGLAVTEQTYQYHNQRVANLIATPPNAPEADTYYVVGAHYDTVPSTPGADDNASAVAVLLELARRLPKQTLSAPVRLVAFTLEEPPIFMTRHQGSRVFVRACKEAGERIAGALVLEMVGYTTPRQQYPYILRWAGYPSQGDFIGIVGNWRSRKLGRTILRAFRKNTQLPAESLFLPLNGWILPSTRFSDHASFWDAGWPALMITDTAFFRNPNYHLPSDTIDTLDFGFMAELVKSLGLALSELQPVS